MCGRKTSKASLNRYREAKASGKRVVIARLSRLIFPEAAG